MKTAWKTGAAMVAAVLAGGAGVARADDGPWEVRVRAVYLAATQDSDSIPALAVPGDAIHVSDKWLPDLDFEYHVTPHWSAELVLTYPQNHDVKVMKSALGGPTGIGTFRELPPTITAKYNFFPDAAFQPYVGLGLNVTMIFDQNINVPVVNQRLDLDHTTVGPAAQVGFDYRLADHLYANVDLKWVMINPDVNLNGVKLANVQVNPLLVGVGLGYRF